MSKLTFESVTEAPSILTEGPVWDYNRKRLFWVDILGKKIFSYEQTTKNLTGWSTPEYVGFIIIRNDGSIIGGLRSGLHHIKLVDNGTTIVNRIDDITEGSENIRYNDGMQDKEGNIWACTMDMKNERTIGKYYFYNQNLVRSVLDEGYIVANGPSLSNDGRILYTVETVGNPAQKKGIYKLSLGEDNKVLKKSLFIKWPSPNTYPDGLITDSQDNLWIGEFGGNVLRCYAATGVIIKEIPVPAWNVTKAVFEGNNEDVLFVTSAGLNVSESIRQNYPYSGNVIRIAGLKNR